MRHTERWIVKRCLAAEGLGRWFDAGSGNIVQVARRMVAAGLLVAEPGEVRRGLNSQRVTVRDCYRATDAGIAAMEAEEARLAELRARR